MTREILGVQIGAQRCSGQPDEWLITYSEHGRHRLIHSVVDKTVQSCFDAIRVAKRDLKIEN